MINFMKVNGTNGNGIAPKKTDRAFVFTQVSKTNNKSLLSSAEKTAKSPGFLNKKAQITNKLSN